jgi:phosphoglycolate phosphatase
LGLTAAVDSALYALELPVAGEERVVTWGTRNCLLPPLRRNSGRTVYAKRVAVRLAVYHDRRRKVSPSPRVTWRAPGEPSSLHAKGLPLALVTNKPTPFVAPLLEALDIAKYFSVDR